MDEHGMENEHLEQRNSSNTEYLPTKCRVTKPPPPKPATNPLQFIKVAPPPLFQKAKEQINKVEKIKKERKEVQDEAEDWQANLDNWKSSRRKLQEHIIERVVEVKKLEHEDTGRNRRRSKTFNEILEERGKSKYSIPIYVDESNDWSDYGISDSKSDHNVDNRIGEQNGLGETEQFSNDRFSSKNNDYNLAAEYSTNMSKTEAKLNNNDYNQDSVVKNGQYTYEGAIEGYRSRIKSKIDDSILNKISDMSKHISKVEVLVPRGEIVKRKELFDKQQTDGNNVPGGAAKVLQDFENSISIKQRLKSLEKCNDQSAKLVDNINIVPKVKQISQLFDQSCTDNTKNYSSEVIQNNTVDYNQRREKININIVPWSEREIQSESPEIYMYIDKNDMKENESQSDDKSSDTFYSGLEDTNYPPSISSTDYMALSSDREDSGIHTADVSCSVSQADDTAEELESNTNSHETVNDDFHLRDKYFKDTEHNNNVYGNHILMLTKENVINQTNIESQEDDTSSLYNSSTISSFSKDNIFDSTVKFLEKVKEDASKDMEATDYQPNEFKDYLDEQIKDTAETSLENMHLPEIREEILKPSDINKPCVPEVQNVSSFGLFNIADPFTPELNSADYMFDSDFPLLPTKMVEPPKVKPPPPPVIDEKPIDPNVKRMNSTKRIKNEITLKRSSFLGLSEPNEVEDHPSEETLIAAPQDEQPRVEEILTKQLDESKISNYNNAESIKFELCVSKDGGYQDWIDTTEKNIEIELKNSSPAEEDEMTKREREIIEMVEKAEKFREPDIVQEVPIIHVHKPPVPLSRTTVPTTYIHKSADASYYDKQPDYLDDQDSEVLKVEQELQQLEQEELKRKRDNLLFRQACSRVLAKNKRYSLENIFDTPSTALECRKSMPELQCLKMEKELSMKTGDMFRSIHDIDLKYRKSVPNIPGCIPQNYSHFPKNEFQTIEKYERKSVPEFQHDVHRSAFEVPTRKPVPPYEPVGSSAKHSHKFIQPKEPSLNYTSTSGELPFVKPRNRNALNNSWLKTRPNIETKSYDQHWLYQEAELRRLQDQKNYLGWQQPKYSSDASAPNLIQRGPITPPHSSSKSSVRKLTSVNTDMQPFLDNHAPLGPPLPVTQPRPVSVEESSQNRILSVSGKKKCSFCGNELGRGAAMIIETLCLFYHMECFKCCVCHLQLGNGLNGTDVRVRNQKLHCHNCYSSDDGVKFSCV